MLGSWPSEPDENGIKVRNIAYTLSLNYSIGPKHSPSTERQVRWWYVLLFRLNSNILFCCYLLCVFWLYKIGEYNFRYSIPRVNLAVFIWSTRNVWMEGFRTEIISMWSIVTAYQKCRATSVVCESRARSSIAKASGDLSKVSLSCYVVWSTVQEPNGNCERSKFQHPRLLDDAWINDT